MKLEEKIRKNSEEIFADGVELPVGHRERFAARLAASKSESQSNVHTQKQAVHGRIVSLRRKVGYFVAVAAVFAGLVFLLDPFSKASVDAESSEPSANDVRNYYAMKLDEEVDATKELAQKVDAAHREELLKNIETIQNDPLPDVQMDDDEHIALIANIYTAKIEILQHIQETIEEIN